MNLVWDLVCNSRQACKWWHVCLTVTIKIVNKSLSINVSEIVRVQKNHLLKRDENLLGFSLNYFPHHTFSVSPSKILVHPIQHEGKTNGRMILNSIRRDFCLAQKSCNLKLCWSNHSGDLNTESVQYSHYSKNWVFSIGVNWFQ